MRSGKRQDTDRGARLNAGTKAGEGKEPSAPDVWWQVPSLTAGCASIIYPSLSLSGAFRSFTGSLIA